MGHARQQLAQGREPLAAPQVGLQTIALVRLAANGSCQAGRQRERQRDPTEASPAAS